MSVIHYEMHLSISLTPVQAHFFFSRSSLILIEIGVQELINTPKTTVWAAVIKKNGVRQTGTDDRNPKLMTN